MTRPLLVAAVFTGAAVLVGSLSAQAVSAARQAAVAVDHSAVPASGAQVEIIGGGTGPDITVGAIQSVVTWTSGADAAVDGIRAYSFGNTICNTGTAPLSTIDGSNLHPLAGSNLFRLHDDRLEQVGQSWLSFLFCALQQNICGTCTPSCGGCCSSLGVGCSNPETASRTGSHSLLGPRDHTVNPVTGFFIQAHQSAQGPNAIRGRAQVRQSDLTLADFPGARFFVEVMEIAPDDAAAGNADNNASWRELSFNQTTFAAALMNTGSGAPGGTVGGTNREEVALFAWQEFDTDAGPQPSQGVTIANADVPDDGRFVLGYEVTNNDDGTWTYEYALMNYNSDRAAQSFSVPVPTGLDITAVGFHDVDYHSYDPDNGSQYDLTDWSVDQSGGGGAITWSGAPFSENPNANALRWGTLYNFRFTANAAPQAVNAAITLFKPGTPMQINVTTHGPRPGPICLADLDASGAVDGIDLGILLAQFFGAGSADLNTSGIVDGVDLGILLNAWGNPGCTQ